MNFRPAMQKFLIPLLFWTLILYACASRPNIPSMDAVTAATELTPEISASPALPIPKLISTVSTPHIDQSPLDLPSSTPTSFNCGYQWAYQDIPELSVQFDLAVKALIPNSTSHASAFGENCIGNDGQVIKFSAMETDFYVFVSVDSMDAYETFGNWIAQVMQVTNSLPPDLLMGPNKGFVEFRFEKSLSETIGLRVSIQQYNDSASRITGENLFRMFYTNP